jgi:hypothetical protein
MQNAVAHLFVPTVSDRFRVCIGLEHTTPLGAPILEAIVERYDATRDGKFDDALGRGWVELGIKNIREFPIFNLVWEQDGILTGLFLKFHCKHTIKGNTADPPHTIRGRIASQPPR